VTGKDRVRISMNHQEPDRVPIWELGFHNAVAQRIVAREVLLVTGGGKTRRAVLRANAQGRADTMLRG
jgi:hypothetical protein